MALFQKKFKYQKQLDTLHALGYTDTKFNKKKLIEYNGDANSVIKDYEAAKTTIRQQAQSMSAINLQRPTKQNDDDTGAAIDWEEHKHANSSNELLQQHQHTSETTLPSIYDYSVRLSSRERTQTAPAHLYSPSAHKQKRYAVPVEEDDDIGTDIGASVLDDPHQTPTAENDRHPYYTRNESISAVTTRLFTRRMSVQLPQSGTMLASTPEPTQDAVAQPAEHIHEVAERVNSFESDSKFDADDSKSPQSDSQQQQQHHRYHEKSGGLNASSRDLFTKDRWNEHVDSVLREKIADYIEDHHIRSVDRLYASMQVTHPQSKQRIKRIFMELQSTTKGAGDNDSNDAAEAKTPLQPAHSSSEHESLNHGLTIEDEKMPTPKTDGDDEHRHQSLNKLLQSAEYQKLKAVYRQLQVVNLKKTNNEYKNKHDMFAEASNEQCKSVRECVCRARCEAVILLYDSLKTSKLWKRVPIGPLISYTISTDTSASEQLYGYEALINDFQHLQIIHARRDRKDFKALCERLENTYKCKMSTCPVFARHYRDRTDLEKSKGLFFHQDEVDKSTQIRNDKDIIIQQLCDRIHSYLLHSMLKFGVDTDTDNYLDNSAAILRRMEINKYAAGRSFSHSSKQSKLHAKRQEKLGKDLERRASLATEVAERQAMLAVGTSTPPILLKQEPIVLKKEPILPKRESVSVSIHTTRSSVSFSQSQFIQQPLQYPGGDADKAWAQKIAAIALDPQTTDADIYELLVEHMGIFRWQAIHGFHYDQNRAHAQLRPKFRNIKEEVLNNEFHCISVFNWNQVLRKSQGFTSSWAGRRIRTKEDGEYVDMITNTRSKWVKGKQITLAEVMTLKLYTDYDRLQFELKKCFRFSLSFSGDMDEEQQQVSRTMLEKRLSHFFHWRISLQVTLQKHGQALHTLCLYHGVNEKMILYPHATTQSFHGPLSTSRSLNVAKTFATDRGMVLKISSMYPRLYHCHAFDASLLSDYPEEEEWLIGFVYTRIRKVHTKELWSVQSLSIESQLRFSFFVIHLFKMQVYSLSEDLAEILSSVIELHQAKFVRGRDFTLAALQNTNSIGRLMTHESERNKQMGEYERKWAFFIAAYMEQKEPAAAAANDANKNVKHASFEEAAPSSGPSDAVNGRIMNLLLDKFDSFASELRIVRFDDISYNLRHHFMNKIGVDVKDNKNVYRISFSKIQKIFRHVEEIYLHNYYKLDDALLQHIIDFLRINKSNTKQMQIKQIKFLYYDYNHSIGDKHNEDRYFRSAKLDTQKRRQLIQLGWDVYEQPMKAMNQSKGEPAYGVRIRLKPIKRKNG